jgi:hypothetical protein
MRYAQAWRLNESTVPPSGSTSIHANTEKTVNELDCICMACEMSIAGEPEEIWKDTVGVCSVEISATTVETHGKN